MADSSFGTLLVGVLIGAWLSSSCMAYDFYVGDRHGWFPNPSEPFNHWAVRNRFQVKDKLVFNYDNESDSVLLVSKEQYDTCNTTDSYLKLEGGQSTYAFSRSGPFYFISGNSTRCKDHGEKLIVIVMTVRGKDRVSPPLSSHPIFPPPPFTVTSPSPAPENAGESPSISPSENEHSSNAPPQHSSSHLISLDFGSGLLVGLLALGFLS
ncbi:early nodulin-like protein 13 [Carex rostrata]